MSFLRRWTQRARIEISLQPSENPAFASQRTIVVESGRRRGQSSGPQTYQVFGRSDPISGQVAIMPEKRIDYQSIKVELVGESVTYRDSKSVETFIALSKELVGMGTMDMKVTYPFEFRSEKEFESYRGIHCDVRYYIRVTVVRKMFNISETQEFWVKQIWLPEERLLDDGIHMEVGLEGIVMLSINYRRVYYDIRSGVIEGVLRFFLVKARIGSCEIAVKRKETTGALDAVAGPQHEEEEILQKFEIIDGTPRKDEVIPVRFFLKSLPESKLTPSDASIARKHRVEYFIHLALCDASGRRFYKQKPIMMYRAPDEESEDPGTAGGFLCQSDYDGDGNADEWRLQEIDKVTAWGADVYTYYHCKKKFTNPGCTLEALDQEMYPMQLPPWAEFLGEVTCPVAAVSQYRCDHWKVDMPWVENLNMELWATNVWFSFQIDDTPQDTIGTWVPVRSHVHMEMGGFPINMDMDYWDVKPEQFDIKKTFIVPTSVCPGALQDIDTCQGDIFPPIKEKSVVFVVDVSGSMSTQEPTKQGQQTRLAVLQEQLDQIVDKGLTTSQLFNMIAFSSGNTFWKSEPVPATAANTADAVGWVKNLAAGGGTYMYNAIKTALNQTGIGAIYFLTDGEPSSASPSQIIQMVKDTEQVLPGVVKIHCTNFFGTGSDLLKKIAEATGGVYTDIQPGQTMFRRFRERIVRTTVFRLFTALISFIHLCMIGIIIFLSPNEIKDSELTLHEVPGEVLRRIKNERESASDQVREYYEIGKGMVEKRVPPGVKTAYVHGVKRVKGMVTRGREGFSKAVSRGRAGLKDLGEDLHVPEITETGAGCWSATKDFMIAILRTFWILIKFFFGCGCCMMLWRRAREQVDIRRSRRRVREPAPEKDVEEEGEDAEEFDEQIVDVPAGTGDPEDADDFAD